MSEWTNNDAQIVQPGEAVIFGANPVPCYNRLIWQRDGTGLFGLRGCSPNRPPMPGQRVASVVYQVNFGANIAVPSTETAGAISLAIAIDGVAIPASEMMVKPAAVDEYANISRAINAQIRSCCGTLSVINTSSIPVLVKNANIMFARPDLLR